MDFFRTYQIDPEMIREILLKLNLDDVVSYCSSNSYYRDQVCHKSFWDRYLDRNYPGIIKTDSELLTTPIYSKYSSKDIIQLLRRIKDRSQYFPRVSSDQIQDIVDNYGWVLLQYLAHSSGYYDVGEALAHYPELEPQSKFQARPRKIYLHLTKSDPPSITSFFQITMTHPPSELEMASTGTLITSDRQPIYSSQLTREDMVQGLNLEPQESPPDLIYLEDDDELDPEDSTSQIASDWVSFNPGIHIPLSFQPKTYYGKGRV